MILFFGGKKDKKKDRHTDRQTGPLINYPLMPRQLCVKWQT